MDPDQNKPPRVLDYASKPPPRRRLTKFERIIFVVLVVILPTLGNRAFVARPTGDLVVLFVSALFGWTIWGTWISLKSRR